jgi:hypothetical protein
MGRYWAAGEGLTMYRWDYAGLQRELKGCSRVDVHVSGYGEMTTKTNRLDLSSRI